MKLMASIKRRALQKERPLRPYYADALACALCGADGHGSWECPLAQPSVPPSRRPRLRHVRSSVIAMSE